jgi:hypothetical protein
MHYLLIALTAYYLWVYLKTGLPDWLPDIFIHLVVVPCLVIFVAYHLPTALLAVGAGCGAIYILDQLFQKKPTKELPQKRRSNIPPPP